MLGIHLAQPFVALHRDAFAAGRGERLEQADRAVDRRGLVLAAQHGRRGRPRIDQLQAGGEFVELARVGGAEQRLVDDRDFLDAAHGALEMKAVLVERALPAALGLVLERVEPLGDVVGRGGPGFEIVGDFGREHAGDCCLFDHLAVIAAVQPGEDVTDLARFLDQLEQVLAGTLLTGCQPQHRILDAGRDQVILERALILEILLGLAAVDLIKRRLRDVDVAALDQLFHLPEKERQQQRANMTAVDIGVGHDDDLVVAQLVGIELVAPDAGAERGDQRADLLAAQHLVEARAFHVQDLAAQRQHGLEFAVAALLGGAAGRVALDDEQFGLGWIAFLTVGELAGQ